MLEFTQGTAVYGIRCNKYSSIPCYGIVISARCDIANGKIDKIFFLTAVSVEKWIFSNHGFNEIVKSKKNSKKKDLENLLEKYGLDFESFKNFNEDEINVVFQDSCVSQKDSNEMKSLLADYKKYTSCAFSLEERSAIIKEKSTVKVLNNIAEGKDSHYIIVPSKSMDGLPGISIKDLVVDLQEIDYWTMDIVDKLKKGTVDCHGTRMTKAEKEVLDKFFCIDDNLGYAEIIGKVVSPWIEFVMQKFTNLFSRIGVDNLSINEISNLIYKNSLQ